MAGVEPSAGERVKRWEICVYERWTQGGFSVDEESLELPGFG